MCHSSFSSGKNGTASKSQCISIDGFIELEKLGFQHARWNQILFSRLMLQRSFISLSPRGNCKKRALHQSIAIILECSSSFHHRGLRCNRVIIITFLTKIHNSIGIKWATETDEIFLELNLMKFGVQDLLLLKKCHLVYTHI